MSLFLLILIAGLLSIAIYYVHYIDLLKDQAESVWKASSSPEWRTGDVKIRRIAMVWNGITYYAGWIPFFLFALCYAAYTEYRRKTSGYFMLSALFAGMILLAAISVFSPLGVRWLMIGLPGMSLVTGWGLARLSWFKHGKIISYILIFVAFLAVIGVWYEIMFASSYHLIF